MSCEEHQLELEQASLQKRAPRAETEAHLGSCQECARYAKLLTETALVLQPPRLSPERAQAIRADITAGARHMSKTWPLLVTPAITVPLILLYGWYLTHAAGRPFQPSFLWLVPILGGWLGMFSSRRRYTADVARLTTPADFFAFYRARQERALWLMRLLGGLVLLAVASSSARVISQALAGRQPVAQTLGYLGVAALVVGVTWLLIWSYSRRVRRILKTLA